MAVELETTRRRGGGEGGRGGIRLPSSLDVPTVDPAVARDPGVRTPEVVSTGLEDIGTGLTALTKGVAAAMARQQKQHDFIKTNETLLDFDKSRAGELQRRTTEDDPSRVAFTDDYGDFLDEITREQLAMLDKDVSPAAKEKLRLDLEARRNASVKAAGKLSLKQAGEKAKDVLETSRRQLADTASKFPELLSDLLAASDDLNAQTAFLNPDQRRDENAKTREAIVLNAVKALAEHGETTRASKMIADNIEDLSATAKASARKAVKAGKTVREQQMVDAVMGFALGQPGLTTVFAAMATGDFGDPALNAQWRALPGTKRLELQGKVLTAVSQRRTLLHNREADADAAAKALSDDDKRELYLTEDLQDRVRIFQHIRDRKTETPEDEERMLAFILGNAGFATIENPALVQTLLGEVERGDMGPDDIIRFQHGVTRDEMKGLMARSRAVQKPEIVDAHRFMERALGIPPGMVQRDRDMTALAEQVDKLKNELDIWFGENPDASKKDIREQRDLLLKDARGKVKEKIDADTMAALKSRAEAIPNLDLIRPEESLKELIAKGELEADSREARRMSSAIRQAKERELLK